MADSAPRTPRPSHQLGDDNNDSDARLSPTQPLSSSRHCLLKGLGLLGRAAGRDAAYHSGLSAVLPPVLSEPDGELQLHERAAGRSFTLHCQTCFEICLSDNSTNSVDGYYGDDVPTASDTDDNAGSCQLDLPSRTVQAVWVVEGLAQHIPDLKADLHVNTEQRTALITLRGQCILKSGPSSGVALYLFIYPESIRSVEFAYTPSPTAPTMEEGQTTSGVNRFIRLCFILTQPPTFVAPKNQPLEPKPRSTALVDALQSLATVKDLSIYLDLLSLVAEAREQLALLPSIFSNTQIRSRLATDEKRASLQRLYAGAGGQIITTGAAACEATHQEADEARPASSTHATSGVLQDAAQISAPTQTRKRSARASGLLPPYLDREDERVIAGPSNHRLFESTEQNASQSQESTQLFSPSDRKGKRPRLATPSDLASPPSLPPLPSALDVVEASADPRKLSFLIQQLLTSIAALENRNAALENRNAALERRVEHLEVARLNPGRLSHHDHDSQTCHQNCRYNTSEASSVRHRIDDAIDAGLDTACSKLEDWAQLEFPEQVRAEMTGQLEDLQRDLGKEWAEDIRDDVKEEVREDVKEEVREETTKDVLSRVAGVVVEAVERSGWLGPGRPGAVGNAAVSTSNLPGESAALYAAIADVQKTHAAEMSEEEVARVMDHLEENLLSAVKYNACGETMRRYFVGQWKADARGVGWRRGGPRW